MSIFRLVHIDSQVADLLNNQQGKIEYCPRSGLLNYAYLEGQLTNVKEFKNFRWAVQHFRFDLDAKSDLLIVLIGLRIIKALITEDVPIRVEKITYKQFLKDLKAFNENMEAA